MAETGRYFGIGLDTKDLDKSVEKGRQGFIRLSEEAVRQGKVIDKVFSGQDLSADLESEFKRLSRMSVEAFGSVSAEARRMMKEIQEDTLSLRNVENMIRGLNKAYEEGSVSMEEYITTSARLTVLHEQISGAIQENEQALKRSTQQMDIAEDSIVSMQAKVALLTTEYMKLSEAQRGGARGEGLLKDISDIQAKLQTAQASMQRYGASSISTWNGLNVSIQQIARELPALAMGPQMFFLAISNNLPMFTDALAQARKEYQMMTAAGKAATPVWKQLLSSLFSWNTALSLATTLLVVYGDDIVNWVTSLFNADSAQKKLNESLTDFNSIMGKSRTEADLLFQAARRTEDGTKGHADAIREINKQYGEYLPHLLSERDSLGELEEAYNIVNEALARNAALKAQSTAIDKVLDESVERQAKALTEMRNIAEGSLGRERGSAAMDIVQSLTEDFRKAGASVEEAWRGVSAKLQFDFGARTLPGGFYESLDDYVRIVYESSREIEAIQERFDPFLNKGKVDKAIIQNKRYWEEVKRQAESVISSIDSEQLLRLRAGNTDGIAEDIVRAYNEAIGQIRKAESNLSPYDFSIGKGNASPALTISVLDEEVELISPEDIEKDIEKARTAMNKWLSEYGDYQQRRLAIIQLYEDRIENASEKGDKLILGEQMRESLARLDDEVQKRTSVITRLFGDMSKKSVEEMRSIADEAERLLSFIESGEYQQDNAFGITEEQFDTLSKSPEKLESVKNEIANVRNEADKTEAELRGISDVLKKIFNTSDKKELEKLFGELNEKVGKVLSSARFLSDTFGKLGDSFGGVFSEIAEGMNVAMDAVNSGMQGAQAGAMFGPIGAAAGAAIGVVSSLASAIAKIHDKKNEKRIQRLQDQIDVLDRSYEKLSDSIEESYSKDASKLIEQNNKLLEQQKILIQQQIREEEDKKKTDDSRIKEWRQQIEDINDAIEENKEKAVDAIFGEDLKTSIENFANAYAEAWSNGENRAASAKETVRKLMQQMATESIKEAIKTSNSMEKIRQKLKEFYADNVLSGWEQDYIYGMAENLQKELDKQFGWADGLMTDKDSASNQQQASRGYQITASQESVDETNGRLTGIQMAVEEIKSQISVGGVNLEAIRNHAAETRDILQSCYSEIIEIRENTGAIVKPIQTMQKDIAEMKNDIKNKM